MKTASPTLVTSLDNDYHHEVAVVLNAEWKHNRFYRTLVDNTPTEDTSGYDIELFPITSITKNNRPKSGINKAIASQAFAETEFHAYVPAARYYMCSVDDQYKYWQSPLISDPGTRVMTNCAPQVVYVEEDGTTLRTVYTNKIHLTVERTYAYPDDYDVQVKTTTGGAWTTVASDLAFSSDGELELWFNGSAWTTTKDLTHATTLAAVRIVVNKMLVPAESRSIPNVVRSTTKQVLTVPAGSFDQSDIGSLITGTGIAASTNILSVKTGYTVPNPTTNIKVFYTELTISKPPTSSGTGTITTAITSKGAYFNLIEMGLALELDITSDLITQSSTFSMGEPDFITPLGNISSNVGKVELMNEDNRYSNNNPSSVLDGLLDKGVKFTCWYVFNDELIQEFELYSDTWDDNTEEGTVSVNLKDNAQVFMDIKPRPVLWQKMPVQEIIWRLCDMIGFTDYVVTEIDTDPRGTINNFWTDGQKTAWEIFGDLARATQTGIFFDSYGKLNVMTRGATWNPNKTVDYTFRDTTVPGGALANIVDGNSEGSYEANKVTVNWKPTDFAEIRDNVTPYQVVWQPEGDVVLRASDIIEDIVDASTYITFGQKDGSTWPYKGFVQIQGEWIEYEGKRYQWWNPTTGARENADIKTLAEQQTLDARTGAFYRHINMYTGKLKIKTRGAYNTQQRDHKVRMTFSNSEWRKTCVRNYVTNYVNPQGQSQNIGSSSYTIRMDTAQEDDYSFLHRGSAVDAPFVYLGTKIKIDKSAHRSKIGGIAFNLQSPSAPSATDIGTGAGYYVEVTATSRMNATMRKTKNEIAFYSMKADGTKKLLGGEKIIIKDRSKGSGGTKKVDIGAEFPVVQDTYVELDIVYSAGTNDAVRVYANGKLVITAVITGASGWKMAGTGRWGIYARGASKVTSEYVYASSNSFGYEPLDGENYYDRLTGGYYANQWQKDWSYDTRTVNRKIRTKWYKLTQKYNQRIYEEFGPIGHEIRKFDVAFTGDTPSLQSKIYFSNTSQVICPWYWSDPKNGHFFLCNISRVNAVVNGEDTLTTGGNGSINHKLFVYGRPLIQKDAQKIEKTDDWAIRRRGNIEVEYDSPWIQNEAEANEFSDWLTEHWTTSDAELSLDVYSNPLIQVADLVHVNYDDIDDDYYVISVSNEFSGGVSTKLTLRKV